MMGAKLELWTILPFFGTLLAIAVLPLWLPHWWEKNRNKATVCAFLAGPLAIYLIAAWGDAGAA